MIRAGSESPEKGEALPRIPEEAFRRTDERPDEESYRLPRLVTHIVEGAIAAVTQFYRESFPVGGEILALVSSWVSHLPPEIEYGRVIGLGMNQNGNRDDARGIRAFVSGTGGGSHQGFGTILPNSEIRNSDTYGVLKLILHAGSYDWRFVPVAGTTFTDSGATACH